MDVNSINETLIKGLQQFQAGQIDALSKTLGLKMGSEFIANVQKVSDATPEQRAELLKNIETALAQLNKSSAAPATRALINQLLEQQQLVQNPALKLVTLQLNGNNTVNNPGTANSVLTFTDKALVPGQALLMKLVDGQKLVVLDPKITTVTGANTAALTTVDINKLFSLSTETLKPNGNTATPDTTLKSSLAANAIGETLRALLPKKDQGQDIFASIPKITQFIQQLPLAERNHWLSSNLQSALKTVADQIRSPAQLTNPKIVEMVVKNSGVNFEQKLANYVTPAVPTPTSGATVTITGETSTKNATAAAAMTKMAMAANLNHTQQLNPQGKTPLSIERMASQDLKGALLGLVQKLDEEARRAATSLTPGALAATEVTKNPQLNNLMNLLGQLINKQQPELDQKVLRAQLVMLLQQHAFGSLAKIQLQQIHTLNQQQTQADQPLPTQSWQVEIPLRQGQEVHHLHMQLEQRWVDDDDEEDAANVKPTKIRQWNIMLSFQLPVVGEFFAQLILLGNNFSAKLWAEKEATLAEAKTKLNLLKEQLEQQGIHVQQIQCMPGLPARPKISLSYSLVDVQT